MSLVDVKTGRPVIRVIHTKTHAFNGHEVAVCEFPDGVQTVPTADLEDGCEECFKDRWLPRCQFCGATR